MEIFIKKAEKVSLRETGVERQLSMCSSCAGVPQGSWNTLTAFDEVLAAIAEPVQVSPELDEKELHQRQQLYIVFKICCFVSQSKLQKEDILRLQNPHRW